MSTLESQARNGRMTELYGLPCTVLRGTFPLERRFSLPLKGEEKEFRNVAPFSVFYHANGKPIGENEPDESNENETLFIGVDIVDEKADGKVLISVPNSGNFWIDPKSLLQFSRLG